MTENQVHRIEQATARALQGNLESGGEKLAKQNKLFVRDRIDLLCDEGSFVEDQLLANSAYGPGMDPNLPADGVVTGVGLVDGRAVCIMANDPTVKAGSWGARTVEKIVRLTETALRALLPMLKAHGLKAMVEPLGFGVCSLRYKDVLAEVIHAVGGVGTYFMVHDTFHHALAGFGPIYPELTGIVHVSGVNDAIYLDDMRDPHRVLVGADDVLGNVAQIRALRAAGYTGAISYEPFAPSVHGLADPAAALKASMEFIRKGVDA